MAPSRQRWTHRCDSRGVGRRNPLACHANPRRPPRSTTSCACAVHASDVDIPRDALVVFSGISGSGKSSPAFGTPYAEAQRRYLESLSPYARRLIDQVGVPDVDAIDGMPPAVIRNPLIQAFRFDHAILSAQLGNSLFHLGKDLCRG